MTNAPNLSGICSVDALCFFKVWADNDGGRGQSDQNAINTVISGMAPGERKRRVKVRSSEINFRNDGHFSYFVCLSSQVYSRELLNSFPRAEFVPFDGYEPPAIVGDESDRSLVTHFAGTYGGATIHSGSSVPPRMLIQVRSLTAQYSDRFLSHPSLPPPPPPPISARCECSVF